MDLQTIRVERADGVVTVTLNRPDLKNAVNDLMWDELLVTFREVGRGDDRVLVLTGAGDGFCSGADVSAMPDRQGTPLDGMRHIGSVCMALHQLRQPTIAKVNGVAAGAGLNMALGCDLIVASSRARFSQIFARRGLTIDFGGSWVLPRLIGLHRAKELALFADIIDATEAQRLGLVNRVVEPEQLDEAVAAWATELAAGPPVALAQTKRLLNDSFSVTLDQALEGEAAAQTVNFATRDTAEAMAAFAEKREPKFEGR